MQDSKTSLINEWKQARQEYGLFCEDGILISEKWETANTKLMFLLKETYSDFHDISGQLGPYGGSTMFFRKMKMRTYIITEMANNRTPNFDVAYSLKEEPNTDIAYVNVKKDVNLQGTWQSDDNDLMAYAVKDKDFLVRQLQMINPEIILCCGTLQYLRILYPDVNEISNNVFRFGETLIISYDHLSSRKSYQKEFDDLTAMLSSVNFDLTT